MGITTMFVSERNASGFDPGWYYQNPDTGLFVGPHATQAAAILAHDGRDPPPSPPANGMVVEELDVEEIELQGKEEAA